MAHIEMMVADQDTPNLRRACTTYCVTAIPNPEREDFVHFVGTNEALSELIRAEFDSDADVKYLITQIQ